MRSSAKIPNRLYISGLYATINISAIIISLGYVYALMAQGTLTSLLSGYLRVSFGIIFVVNIPFCLWVTSPISRLQSALVKNELLDEPLIRRSLNLSLKVGVMIFIQFVLLLIPVVINISGWSSDILSHLIIIAGVVPLMHGLLGYYIFALFQRKKITAVLFSETSLPPMFSLSITKTWYHIAVLIILLVIVLPVSIGIILAAEEKRIALIQYLSIHFVVVGSLIGWAALRAVFQPVEELYSLMTKVKDGDLNVKAKIYAVDTMGALSQHFNLMVQGLQQREHIRRVFGRYVAKEVADVILDGHVNLGGEKRIATILFTDIRCFTNLSERLSPEEVVTFLNEYFEVMVSCVTECGGIVDKFIGDAILCVFGAPVKGESISADAISAMNCAKKMREALVSLNAKRSKNGQQAIKMGIGVHTGPLVVGNIGTTERMEYTVIGDTVNLCSRLEQMTKDLHRAVLVSDTTAELVKEEFELQELTTIEVRGRKEKVTVFYLNNA
jgi:class 3 adenylate cyclase